MRRVCRVELDEREFHRIASQTLEHLQDQLDDFVENELDFGDVSYEVRTSARTAARARTCRRRNALAMIALGAARLRDARLRTTCRSRDFRGACPFLRAM